MRSLKDLLSRLGVKAEKAAPAPDLPAGASHYRAYVGPPERYDLVAAIQFNLMTSLGLREGHSLLDIGCGSLRGGRLFIPYLLPGRYFGLEPERWLIDEGVRNELGRDILRVKRPTFSHDRDFTLTAFGRKFDFLLAQSIFSHASPAQIARHHQGRGGGLSVFLSFSRSVFRSTARISAAFVLLPPTLASTLRMYSASTSAKVRVKSGLRGMENRMTGGRSGTSMRSPSDITTRRWTAFSSSRTLPGQE